MATRKPVPSAFGDERADQLHGASCPRATVRCSSRGVRGRRRSSRRLRATSEVIRSRSSTTVASNAAGVPTGTGSGTDQCSHPGSATPSSWARSHTVTTSAGRSSTSSRWRGVAPLRSSPARRAAATASGWTRSAGWVPAEVAGAPVSWRHRAAATWERAELCVQTNSAGSAGSRAPGRQVVEGLAVQVHVAAAPVPRGAGAADEPDPLQHVEVVGQQVRGQLDEGLELARHPVRDEQLVDDGETDGVAERGVPLGSGGSRGIHHPTIPLDTS